MTRQRIDITLDDVIKLLVDEQPRYNELSKDLRDQLENIGKFPTTKFYSVADLCYNEPIILAKPMTSRHRSDLTIFESSSLLLSDYLFTCY